MGLGTFAPILPTIAIAAISKQFLPVALDFAGKKIDKIYQEMQQFVQEGKGTEQQLLLARIATPCLGFLRKVMPSTKESLDEALSNDKKLQQFLSEILNNDQKRDEFENRLKKFLTGQENFEEFAKDAKEIVGTNVGWKAIEAYREFAGLIYDKEILNKIWEIAQISDQYRERIEIDLEMLRKDLDTNYAKFGEQIKELRWLASQVIVQNGFEEISSDYFENHIMNVEDFEDWKDGRNFTLPSIYREKEFRRNDVINTIKEGLDKYKMLLIKGAPSTSKTTLLMEIICDYFKENYVVLWNKGDAIGSPSEVINYIQRLLDDDCNILVAVDDIHKENSSIFYIREEIKKYKKSDNVKFILTAGMPDFKRLIDPTNFPLLEIPSQAVRDPIRDFFQKVRDNKNPQLQYELLPFTKDEVKGFIEKYQSSASSEFNQELEKKSIDELVEVYSKDTTATPLILKFSIFKRGLSFDVEERFDQHFCDTRGEKDANKIETMSACSFIEIGNHIQLTKQILKSANIWSYAKDLIKVTLYEDIPLNLLKTIHVEWDKEFLSLVYNTNNTNDEEKDFGYLSKTVEFVYNVIKSGLQANEEQARGSLGNIFDTLFCKLASQTTISGKKIIPPPLADAIFKKIVEENKPHITHQELSKLITAHPANARLNMAVDCSQTNDYKKEKVHYDKALKYYEESLELDSKNIDAWFNKGIVLDKLSYKKKSYEKRSTYSMEANKSIEEALAINNKDAGYWADKAYVLTQLGKYDAASKFAKKSSMINKNYEYAKDLQCQIKNLKDDYNAITSKKVLKTITLINKKGMKSPEKRFIKILSDSIPQSYDNGRQTYEQIISTVDPRKFNSAGRARFVNFGAQLGHTALCSLRVKGNIQSKLGN